MQTIQFLILVIVLIIFAEASYLSVIAPRHFAMRRQLRPILLDTSVLIDGRIIAVAQTGFISGAMIIPRSVLGELQFLADNGDHEKRSRARFGLDVVSELQAIPGTDVQILQDGSKADEGVDERLLHLAKKHNASICTIDFNLNKVAMVEGITVLNVNELAQSLRMAFLPGEKMRLDLVQKGQDTHQAVGYLPDGTMVVVEHANKLVGQEVEVEIIRSLQTAAGRMMFARRLDGGNEHISTAKPSSNQRSQGKPARRLESTSKEMTPAAGPQPQKNPTPSRPRPHTYTQPAQPRTNRGRKGPSDVEDELISLIERT